MLSLSLSSSITSPKFVPQSNPSSFAGNLPISPKSATIRRVISATATACAAVETATSQSFYDVLGISAAASNAEIKAAYRRLARSCHPDVAGDGENDNNSAGDAFIKVHAAYSTLLDPEKRADYDRRLFIRSPVIGVRFSGISSSPSSFCSSPRRNWETDQCW